MMIELDRYVKSLYHAICSVSVVTFILSMALFCFGFAQFGWAIALLGIGLDAGFVIVWMDLKKATEQDDVEF